MAKDSGLFEMVLVLGIGGFAVLYLTRNFCSGGAFPVDGLCYENLGEPGSDECQRDPAACGAVNTDPDYAGGSAGPKTSPPTRADDCNRWNGVWRANKCHCNRVDKRCPANAVVNIVNSKCACVYCPAGTKRSTTSAMANSCIKTSAGTVTGGGTCSGKSGNCNWDCKNAYCWTSKGPKVNKVCIVGNSNRNYSCNLAKQKFLNANKSTGSGPISPSGVKVENAKLFIADYISRTVRTCTGIYVSNQKIIQGWPNNVNTLAKQNNYTQGAFVQYNNRPFAKLLRDTIVAVIRAYRGNMNSTCNQKMACLNGRSLRECGLA